MRKCPHCSKKISDTDRKCKFCGAWIIEEKSSVQKEPMVENNIVYKDDIKQKNKNIVKNESNDEDNNSLLTYIIIFLSILILWAVFSYFSRW